jgi:hypothetical protein
MTVYKMMWIQDFTPEGLVRFELVFKKGKALK